MKGDKEEIVDLSSMPPLECDEEVVKGEKGLKVLTPSKLSTRRPVLLTQIRTKNS